jgi:hypothetical protein
MRTQTVSGKCTLRCTVQYWVFLNSSAFAALGSSCELDSITSWVVQYEDFLRTAEKKVYKYNFLFLLTHGTPGPLCTHQSTPFSLAFSP